MNETLPLGRRKGFRATVVAGVLILGITAVAVVLVLGPRGSGTATTDGGRLPTTAVGGGTRTSDANAVTVSVEWPGSAAGPAFKVALDTHSVNLEGYDLGRLATLRVDQGGEIRATGWDAPSGSHHREGTLQFPATTADGRPLIGSATRTIELVIRDLAGVPQRTFRWP